MPGNKRIRHRIDSSDQSSRFIETARELGCDEDPEAFKRALQKIAKPKPKRVAGDIVDKKEPKR